MTFGCKVYNIVYIVFSKELICEFAVSDVAFYKKATLVIDIVFYSTKISSIGNFLFSRYLMKFAPIKPAAPVTRYVFIYF